MRTILVLTLVALAAGCRTAPPPGLSFTTDEASYVPGDEAQLQLVNGTDQTLGYNLCFSDLQRQAGGEWQIVADPETACTTIQRGLAPGDSATFAKTIMPEVPPGTYRYRTDVEFQDDERQEEAVTDAFRVEE